MRPSAISDRWVMCDHCGAPLKAAATASSVHCPDCDLAVTLPPRSDAPLGSRDNLGEEERLRRLREQDGRPLLPPAGLEGLLVGGDLPPYKEREAIELYLADRRKLRDDSDPAAQERLMFLTLVLANHLDDPAQKRALYETSLDAAQLQRHQQALRGYLAREAARLGDTRAAEAWLDPCDPRSDDLDMDSTWRFSRATIALMRGDWYEVLEVLGAEPEDIPVTDSIDAVAAVYRAHAHEKLGDLERAATQLAAAMEGGDRRAIESIVSHRPEWGLCAESIEVARARYAKTAAASARGMSGGGIGAVMLAAGLLTGGIGVAMLIGGAVMMAQGASEDAVGLMIGGVITAIVGGPVVGGIGWRHFRDARRDARIRTQGLPATGTVVSAQRTGTEINDVPLMEITLRIHMEDRPPWEASTRILVPPQNTSILEAGSTLYVRVDPEDPSRVVLDTG